MHRFALRVFKCMTSYSSSWTYSQWCVVPHGKLPIPLSRSSQWVCDFTESSPYSNLQRQRLLLVIPFKPSFFRSDRGFCFSYWNKILKMSSERLSLRCRQHIAYFARLTVLFNSCRTVSIEALTIAIGVFRSLLSTVRSPQPWLVWQANLTC